MLDDPDIKDQFAIPYPLGTALKIPAVNADPGRIRNEALFVKMYDDCRRGEVTKRLKAVTWLPDRGGGTVMVTTVNGVADRLADVARSLATVPVAMTKYLVPSAGTYNCRPIAQTNRLSVHAYGAAIDLATKFGDYWLWPKGKDGRIAWKNRFPLEIVDIFERTGFIWGGKWYHFDTFHFEYRPEIIALAKQGWPGN
jgi:D-alanyl-D-alanine carboxypeptidase-like protein